MTDSYVIVYVYEADGSPLGMQYLDLTSTDAEWEIYWFEKNLQGDVIAVYDDSGTKHLKYTYDAWGNASLSYYSAGIYSNADLNPFRYRGYYFDTDLGLYYLQSRYYDAKIGRFINADSALYHSMLGYNMFVYCSNNPVNFYDPAGRNEAALIAGLLGISVADGPLPIGDIIAALVITAYVFGYVAKADDALNESPTASNSAGEDATEEPPQSITEPEDKSTSESKGKDSRLKGTPGITKRNGNTETHIGSDGRADKERHNTDHGHPKNHTNPHDHTITWDESGNPSFGKPENYWDGNVPIFP